MDPNEATVNQSKTENKSDWSFLKVLVDRNEPKVHFGSPKFTQYSYVDKEDGRKRIVVKCEMESQLVLPEGFFRDDEMGTEEFIHYPSVKVIKTTGKAICDERDEENFSLTLGMRVSRVRAEKRAFERHAKALEARMTKLLDFYHNSLDSFMAKADKVLADEIIWEEKKKEETPSEEK
jgi:hypothetical protein